MCRSIHNFWLINICCQSNCRVSAVFSFLWCNNVDWVDEKNHIRLVRKQTENIRNVAYCWECCWSVLVLARKLASAWLWVSEWMNEWMSFEEFSLHHQCHKFRPSAHYSVVKRVNEWMVGWMDGWMDGWNDGWIMHGWMDAWMDAPNKRVNFCFTVRASWGHRHHCQNV